MRLHSLLLGILLLSPFQAISGEYKPGYSARRSCFKNEYREVYVSGTSSYPGYVQSYIERIQVPCRTPGSWKTVRYYHYLPNRGYRKNQVLVTQRYRKPQSSCSAGSVTTGGLLGGGLAAALSKKDAYGWSIPLGAVLGVGIANSDC